MQLESNSQGEKQFLGLETQHRNKSKAFFLSSIEFIHFFLCSNEAAIAAELLGITTTVSNCTVQNMAAFIRTFAPAQQR